MTEAYSTYINSEAWQKKRAERLAINNFRCSACPTHNRIHVHHLTYERIFNEDMSDLLPLCEIHHKVAEELVRNGNIPRRGNVLFLASETMRLILSDTPLPKFLKSDPVATIRQRGKKPVIRNLVQEGIMSEPEFIQSLALNRKSFVRSFIKNRKRTPSYSSNAMALYDRLGSGGLYNKSK